MPEAEEHINVWKCRKLSPLHYYYMYADTDAYIADSIFIKHQVRVYFSHEFMKPGANYVLVFCKIKKKDEVKFLAAIDELRKNMLLTGHNDYESFCSEMRELIDKGIEN